ncbi:MAG: CHAT domain-containing protein [Stenotrophomonas sp.]
MVVVEQEFSVTVGLRQRHDHTLIGTGAITVAPDETIEVVLVFDPDSLTTTAPTRQPLTVSAADPYPSVTVPFVAKYLDAEVPVERRIGVHYVRKGQVVGVAWRTVVAVDEAGQVVGAPEVATRERRLINLNTLLDETPPDLVIGICSADNPDGKRLVWTVYPGVDGGVALDGPRSAPMDDTAAGFAKALRFKIQFGSDPDAVYQDLAGSGAVLGRIMPESVRSVIRKVVEDPARTAAATILLLTEELHLPWELTTFKPPLASSWGGAAPFLGAHAAIGRWPLSEGDPRPVPRPRVQVAKAAVLSAKYDGVTKWGKLDEAEAEAAEVTTLFGAELVLPTIPAVASLFAGTPTVQLVHVALHGQFDTEGTAEGLVLLAVDAAGAQTAKATFFSPLAAENGHLAAGPFVFLNACQVGADRAVLGDYGGFASTLLRIGATGVVAPLWNVDDDVAATMAREFYAATWSAKPADRVSVAEAMRRTRARYTLEGVGQRVPGVSPTLVAFQCLAHPQLRLTSA